METYRVNGQVVTARPYQEMNHLAQQAWMGKAREGIPYVWEYMGVLLTHGAPAPMIRLVWQPRSL